MTWRSLADCPRSALVEYNVACYNMPANELKPCASYAEERLTDAGWHSRSLSSILRTGAPHCTSCWMRRGART